MTSAPEDDYEPPEQSFADVMNAFSFDSGGRSKRRRGKRRDDESEGPMTGPQPAAADPPDTPGRGWPANPSERSWPDGPVEFPLSPLDLPVPEPVEPDDGAAAVRPYAWTRGRTKSGFDLAIETLLSTSQRGREQMGFLPVEHRAVAQLCEQARSVAEVAALLSIPLGVARVLLGDMAGLGLVLVHQTITSAGSGPDLALMERVLSGLRRL